MSSVKFGVLQESVVAVKRKLVSIPSLSRIRTMTSHGASVDGSLVAHTGSTDEEGEVEGMRGRLQSAQDLDEDVTHIKDDVEVFSSDDTREECKTKHPNDEVPRFDDDVTRLNDVVPRGREVSTRSSEGVASGDEYPSTASSDYDSDNAATHFKTGVRGGTEAERDRPDGDTSERGGKRKPGIWVSFKRAVFGGKSDEGTGGSTLQQIDDKSSGDVTAGLDDRKLQDRALESVRTVVRQQRQQHSVAAKPDL